MQSVGRASVVNAAAFDFSQTEDFLQAAESLTCPYMWTRYDVLCHHPRSLRWHGESLPHFVTPTLLTETSPSQMW